MAEERSARAEPLGRSARARRRGAELENAILRAAAEELTESGYAGLTMDRVARRAGNDKNTIYRRGPTERRWASPLTISWPPPLCPVPISVSYAATLWS